MNQQSTSSINFGNAGRAHNKAAILNHNPAGKRKALSVISTNGLGHKQVLDKCHNKVADGKSFHQSTAFQTKQCVEQRPVFRYLHQPDLQGKPPKAFQIFCDAEQNKENSRPATSEENFCGTVTRQQQPIEVESPGVQQEREEEEILVVDSPMVVDSTLENLTLKESLQQREYLFPEYSREIYTYLKGAEARLRPRVNYMRKQTDITCGMRRILVDWLVEVCQEYKLDQETLYLTVSYIDRFLSCMAVLRAKLQLVGTACMFIAAKYEEIYPPDVKEFVYITDDTYTKQQVLRMEHLVLKVLSFDLAIPTANFFLQRFCSLCSLPTSTACLAKYLCELSLLEVDPFLKYLPSVTACASIALANHTLGKEMWTPDLRLVTQYVEEDFRECLESLYASYQEAATCPQQAIQEKYRSHIFHCVSSITPPPSLPPM